ncbi:MAG: carbohydrate-binding protein [Armatimonadota bacterium]
MRALLAATAMMVLAPCSVVTHADDERAAVVTVEAEDYADMHGLRVIERAEASDSRTVSYWEEPGSWLDVEFDLPVAGSYVISIRYALNWPDTRRAVLLDDNELGEVELETTGSWGDFETVTLPFEPLELPAGKVTVRVLNRDSRGLSLDWVAMHAPEAPLADRHLGAEERAELRGRVVEVVGPGARRILDRGEVELHAARAGGPAWADVSGHLLAAGGMQGEARGAIMRRSTEHHQIALVGEGAGGDGLVIAITDGTSLHLVRPAGDSSAMPLPAPVLSAEGMRIVTARAPDHGALHLPAGDWQERTDHLEAGGMHITVAPGMTVRPWDDRGLAPELALEMAECGGAGHVGVARFSPRWGGEQPRVTLERDGEDCVIRESVERHPTLAAFYGEGMFDLRITPEGRITFDDIRSGETVVLREGR